MSELSERVLRDSNIPSRYWPKFKVKDFPVPLAIALEDLEASFVACENFYLYGSDFVRRTSVVYMFAKMALNRKHHYARSVIAGMPEKPVNPNVISHNFSVRIDNVATLVKWKMDDERIVDEADQDIFILTEVGADMTNRMHSAAIDDLIRIRYNRGLMTVVVANKDIRKDDVYQPSTLELLRTYTEVKL